MQRIVHVDEPVRVSVYADPDRRSQTIPLRLPEGIENIELLLDGEVLFGKDGKQQHFDIQRIADECAFNSITSFYSAFRRHYNMTPGEYRIRLDHGMELPDDLCRVFKISLRYSLRLFFQNSPCLCQREMGDRADHEKCQTGIRGNGEHSSGNCENVSYSPNLRSCGLPLKNKNRG